MHTINCSCVVTVSARQIHNTLCYFSWPARKNAGHSTCLSSYPRGGSLHLLLRRSSDERQINQSDRLRVTGQQQGYNIGCWLFSPASGWQEIYSRVGFTGVGVAVSRRAGQRWDKHTGTIRNTDRKRETLTHCSSTRLRPLTAQLVSPHWRCYTGFKQQRLFLRLLST